MCGYLDQSLPLSENFQSFGMDIIGQLRDLIFYLGLMTPACFESLIVDLNFSDTDCIKSAVSKTLGLGIVVGSSLVKVPQVLKIMASGSAEGISFMSILLELIAITFSGVYGFSNNFPFSAYGESLFLAIQTGIIGLLVLSFTKGKLSALLFLSLYAGKSMSISGVGDCKLFSSGAVWALMNPLITPAEFLWFGQASNIPMILLGEKNSNEVISKS